MERFFHEAGFENAISPVSDVTGLVTLRQEISELMQTPFFVPQYWNICFLTSVRLKCFLQRARLGKASSILLS
jgi:hypothetical protein